MRGKRSCPQDVDQVPSTVVCVHVDPIDPLDIFQTMASSFFSALSGRLDAPTTQHRPRLSEEVQSRVLESAIEALTGIRRGDGDLSSRNDVARIDTGIHIMKGHARRRSVHDAPDVWIRATVIGEVCRMKIDAST